MTTNTRPTEVVAPWRLEDTNGTEAARSALGAGRFTPRSIEADLRRLLCDREARLVEMSHRIANNLQIVASLLLVKARRAECAELKADLMDAHCRVMSVAAMQSQVSVDRGHETIDIGRYLVRLCGTLTEAMLSDPARIDVSVDAPNARFSGEEAVNLGLIVTELLLNSIKHAFPDRSHGSIRVAFAAKDDKWTLSVEDDGVGAVKTTAASDRYGLGTGIVDALAASLGAVVVRTFGRKGVRVAVEGVWPRPWTGALRGPDGRA